MTASIGQVAPSIGQVTPSIGQLFASIGHEVIGPGKAGHAVAHEHEFLPARCPQLPTRCVSGGRAGGIDEAWATSMRT
ncbi:hypothetical protein [Williamsia sp. M5A3_1d]